MEIGTFPGFSGHLEASGVSDVTFDFFGSMQKGKCCRLLSKNFTFVLMNG